MKKLFFIFVLSTLYIAHPNPVFAEDEAQKALSAPLHVAATTISSITDTIFSLGSIHVSPTRLRDSEHDPDLTRLPRTVSIKTQDEIDSAPSLSLPEVLSKDNLVTYSDDLGQGLGARVDMRGFGGEAKQALVLLDGLRAVEPFDNSVTWNLYPKEFMEKAELYPGGNSSIYGEGALSGAISLHTKGPTKEWTVKTENSVGSYRLLKNFIEWSGTMPSGVGLWTGVRKTETDGYRQNSSFNSIAAENVVQWPVTEFLNLENRFFYADNATGIPGPLTSLEVEANRRQKDPDGQFGDKFQDRLIQNGMLLEYWAEPADLGITNLAGYRLRDQNSVQSFGGAFPGKSLNNLGTESFSDTLQAARSWQLFEAVHDTVTMGLEWFIDDIHNPFRFEDQTFGPFESERSIDRTAWALFLQNEIQIGDEWTLHAGTRYDKIHWNIYDLRSPTLEKNKKSDAVSPSASLAYRMSPNWTWYGGYSEAFKVPDANTLIFETPNLFSPNPAIDSSRAHHWELGFRAVPQKEFRVDGSLFLVQTKKEILFNDITNTNENFDTERRGGEMTAEKRIDSHWSVRASYSFTRAVFEGGFFDKKDIPLVPKSRWSAGVSWKPLQDWELNTEAVGVLDQFALNDFNNIFHAEDYWTMNVSVVRKLPKGQVFLNLSNILNEQYSSFTTSNGVDTLNLNPAPGMNLEAGVRFEI